MLLPITKTLNTYALAGLMALVTWGAAGHVDSSFAETTMNDDIIMTIDTSEDFVDETTMFKNILYVFISAYIVTDGNPDIVVLDHNTVCISPRSDSGGCSSHASQGSRQVAMDAESYDNGMLIFSTYDD